MLKWLSAAVVNCTQPVNPPAPPDGVAVFRWSRGLRFCRWAVQLARPHHDTKKDPRRQPEVLQIARSLTDRCELLSTFLASWALYVNPNRWPPLGAEFLVPASIALTSAEALVASQLSYWVQKALEGKGGKEDLDGNRWSWLSASDLRDRLNRRFYSDLTEHSLYRVLKSLVNKGWFVRAQLLYSTHRNSTYFYRFGPNHPVGQVTSEEATAAANPGPTELQAPTEQECNSGVSLLYTPSISSKSLTKNPSKGPSKAATAATSQTAISTSSGGRTAEQPAAPPLDRVKTAPGGPQAAREGALNRCPVPAVAAVSKAPLATHKRPLVKSLNRVLERCLELAGLTESEASLVEPPSRLVSGDRLTELVKVEGVLHRVADPLATAPLR